MKEKGKGTVGRFALLVTLVAVVGATFAAMAYANNLDRQTATDAAREVARRECRNTTGCEEFFVRDLHRVSRHKAIGKTHVISHKNGIRFDCVRQIVVKLDHESGEINYATSARRCKDLGPQ